MRDEGSFQPTLDGWLRFIGLGLGLGLGYYKFIRACQPFSRVSGNVKIRPRKACNDPKLRSFGLVSYDKVGVLCSGKLGNRSEVDRRHVPPISEAIRGSGGIEQSYVSTKEKKVSTLRGPAQLADLQGALSVPTYSLTVRYPRLGRSRRGRAFHSPPTPGVTYIDCCVL